MEQKETACFNYKVFEEINVSHHEESAAGVLEIKGKC